MRNWAPNILRISALLMVSLAMPARAAEWEWTLVSYIWASDMSVDAVISDQVVIGGELKFSDLIDKVEAAAQLHFEGRRGRAGFFLDLTYLDVADEVTTPAMPPLPGGTSIESDVTTILFEAGGTLRPFGAEKPFELFLGVRVIDLDLEVEITLPPPLVASTKARASESIVDVFGGARFLVPLSEHWFVTLRGDIGTGDTDFTWNVVGMAGYQFGKRNQFAALLGYRHMEIELEESAGGVGVEAELTMSGPFAALGFYF